MRKALTFALTLALVATFVTQLSLMAQTRATASTVAGRSVDVMGRGMVGERVELVRETEVISTGTTNALGEWSFRNVEPGVYVVRMNVRGRVAGVRVTVAAGQPVAGAMIVVPAATASAQLGLLSNLVSLIPAASATAVSAAAATIVETDTVELSPALLVQILNAMPADERQAFAEAVVAAVQSNPTGAGVFTQYQAQFQNIAQNPTAPVAVGTFPPPQPVS